MHVSVNELSFMGQAPNRQAASNLMRGLGQLLKATEPIRGTDPVCAHSTVCNRNLCNDYTVHDWIHEDSVDRDARIIFIILFKSGPFIDKIVEDAGITCTCTAFGADVSFSSFAGVCHLGGILASLNGAEGYSTGEISLLSCASGMPESVLNLTQPADVSLLRRIYRPIPKHQPGGFGTLMDLTDATAQDILDRGVSHGKQIYGFFGGRYYEFQPERLRVFHGYPIPENDVPALAKRELMRQRFP